MQEFLEQPWVKDDTEGQPELLFMQRATRSGDRWSGHVAYIGGKNEPGETDFETVTREVFEESGLDLTSDSFMQLGRLDDREIISTFNKQLMMILIPFVFLQVVPYTPTLELEKDEVASVEWVPLDFFLSSTSMINTAATGAVESLTPRVLFGWRRRLLQPLLGTITFPAIDLPVHDITIHDPDDQQPHHHISPPRRFRLWGLTLGMTRDLIELAGQDDLPFLALVAGTPRYSRKDLGWWIHCLTIVTLFWRRKVTHSMSYPSSQSRQQADWIKVYHGSIRTGLAMAMVGRLVVVSLGISWLVRLYRRQFI
ncbi:unnamed protein product [Absidia cylindrospora]